MKRHYLIISFLVFVLLFAESTKTVKTEESKNSEIDNFNLDWSNFWKNYKSYANWVLEWYNTTVWINKNYIRIEDKPIYQNNTFSKFKTTLYLNTVESGNYRMFYIIKQPYIDYINKSKDSEFVLTYKEYNITFNWVDLKPINNLILKYGILWNETDENKISYNVNYFWFMIQRNNIPSRLGIVLDPSTIATSTVGYALDLQPQRKIIKPPIIQEQINNYTFAYYHNGSHLVMKTSLNYSVWTNLTIIKDIKDSGGSFAVGSFENYYSYWYVYLIYILTITNGESLVFRRGIYYNHQYQILWGTERPIYNVSSATFILYYPNICVSDNGTIFVTVNRRHSGGTNRISLFTNVNNAGSGTWLVTHNWNTVSVSSASNFWTSSLEPLSDNKVLGVYTNKGQTKLFSKLFNTSGKWETEITAYNDGSYNAETFSTSSFENKVFLVWTNLNFIITNNTFFMIYTFGSGWSTREFASTVKSSSGVSLTLDRVTLDVYVFFRNATGTNKIVYNKRVNSTSTWKTNAIFVSGETYLLPYSISSFKYVVNYEIGVAWSKGISSPFPIMFSYLNFAPQVINEVINIYDMIIKYPIFIFAEQINIIDFISKQISIFKTESISILDSIFIIIELNLIEELITETLSIGDSVSYLIAESMIGLPLLVYAFLAITTLLCSIGVIYYYRRK